MPESIVRLTLDELADALGVADGVEFVDAWLDRACREPYLNLRTRSEMFRDTPEGSELRRIELAAVRPKRRRKP